MSEDVHLRRAELLLDQGRHAQAEAELRQALARDPGDWFALALLALALAGLDRLDAAEGAAGQAVASGPDEGFAHHALGRVLLARRREAEAVTAAEEAIRLEPDHPGHRALLGQARLAQRRWADALAAADAGLALDPEHGGCSQLRAVALVQAGRRDEAQAELQRALARDPDDASTHTAAGWARLHAGDAQGALGHFQEALRLDPTEDAARAGIVQALQARYRLYALLLRYLLFMSRLTSGQQWGVIIGGYLGYRLVLSHAREHPERAPWLYPLVGLYVAFALLTWLGQPLFNLALRLDRFGRHALDDDQRRGANLVGVTLALALVLAGVWLATGSALASFAAIGAGLLLLPVSAIHACDAGWPRKAMTAYTLALVAVPVLTVVVAFAAPGHAARAGRVGAQAFLLGCVASGFVANGLASARPRR